MPADDYQATITIEVNSTEIEEVPAEWEPGVNHVVITVEIDGVETGVYYVDVTYTPSEG